MESSVKQTLLNNSKAIKEWITTEIEDDAVSGQLVLLVLLCVVVLTLIIVIITLTIKLCCCKSSTCGSSRSGSQRSLLSNNPYQWDQLTVYPNTWKNSSPEPVCSTKQNEWITRLLDGRLPDEKHEAGAPVCAV